MPFSHAVMSLDPAKNVQIQPAKLTELVKRANTNANAKSDLLPRSPTKKKTIGAFKKKEA
jgi:hypothetical protein